MGFVEWQPQWPSLLGLEFQGERFTVAGDGLINVLRLADHYDLELAFPGHPDRPGGNEQRERGEIDGTGNLRAAFDPF